MLSFHNEQQLKDSLLKKLKEHSKNDNFISDGKYILGGSTKRHPIDLSIAAFGGEPDIERAYEALFGVPEVLVGVFRGIFNGLHEHQQSWWTLTSVDAIPVSRDLSGIWPAFAEKLLDDSKIGVTAPTDRGPLHTFRELLPLILSLLVRAIKNKSLVEEDEWSRAATEVDKAVNYACSRPTQKERAPLLTISNIFYSAHSIYTSNKHADKNASASDVHMSMASDFAKSAVYYAALAKSEYTNICRQTELQALALIELLETYDYG